MVTAKNQHNNEYGRSILSYSQSGLQILHFHLERTTEYYVRLLPMSYMIVPRSNGLILFYLIIIMTKSTRMISTSQCTGKHVFCWKIHTKIQNTPCALQSR